ncbi:hypothetical protein [Streptomyces sp. NPDC001568]|uniref:hypothetical protein n=1 Tax=Streptomyces sp. NPDC001568 TaxID=3364588 RepID=UPI0036CDE735
MPPSLTASAPRPAAHPQASVLKEAIRRTIAERLGNTELVVGGIGRGALAAGHALLQAERSSEEHATAIFFSYNGTAPAGEEGKELEALGGWPVRPLNLKLVSADFTSTLDDEGFAETKNGAANPGGPLITKELGSWLLDYLR